MVKLSKLQSVYLCFQSSLSSEGSEEMVESLPGFSEPIIERHEEVAKLAMICIVAAGLAALTGLFLLRKSSVARIIKIAVLLLSFVSRGLLVQNAHLGGQIRHTGIRSESIVQGGADGGVGE